MSGQIQHYAPGLSPPITKRRRIALACNACRMRKSRCNGQRPTCSSCTGLGVTCEYEPTDSATNILVRKEHLSDLEQRVAANERKLQQVDLLLKGHLSNCGNGQHGARLTSAVPSESPYHAENLEEPADEDATTNGMAMTFLEERMSAFFGESSNLSFTRFLLRATAAMGRPLSDAQTTLDSITVEKSMAKLGRVESPYIQARTNQREFEITALPSADVMEKLLDSYFEHPGYVFSFVHEPTMRQQYAEFKKNGFSKSRRTWLGLLNMIFALSSRFDLDENDTASGKDRSDRSDLFYKRAIGLCGELSKRVVSLEIIQYLVLVVLHCQGTQRSTQAWILFGTLVRSATALGLHGNYRGADPILTESFRRTWLVIYGLDRLLSMVFGRPMAIMDEQMAALVPRQARIDEPSDNVGFAGQFLDVSSHLYQILGTSLIKQYGANVDNYRHEADDLTLLQVTEEIRKSLRSWRNELPAYLRLCQPGTVTMLESTKKNRLRVILTLRYYNLNVLVHRPLLSAAIRHLSNKDISPYTSQAIRAGAAECVFSAQTTIDMIHSIVTTDPTSKNNLGIWFFTLYYAFTSSLMVCGDLLLAKYCEGGQNADSITSLTNSLDKSQAIFQNLNRDDALVHSCSQYIRMLSELYTSRAKTSLEMGTNGATDISYSGDVGDFPFMPDTLGIMNPEDMNAFMTSEMIDPSIYGVF